MRKQFAAAVGLATAVLALGVPSASAKPDHGGNAQSQGMQVVVPDLNNPRQITVHGGAVYVAEAGTGGDTCFDVAPDVNICAGLTGSVTRYKQGESSRVQTGLLSIGSPEGEVVGVDDVTFKGNQLYGIATGGCVAPGFTVPAELAAQAGQLLQLNGGTSATSIGDPGTFECTNDPDGQGPDTDPYGVAFRGNTAYVADAAGNDIVSIQNGQTSLAKVLSTTGQPVPTSLAWGPDGALYIGTLNFEAGPGGAAVLRLDPKTGDLTTYASGLTAVTAIAFGGDGTLYVTEWTTGFDQNGPLPNGDVVAIPPGGGTDGRQVIGAGDLHFPTGVGVQGNTLYVSNWGVSTGSGPGPHGELVSFPLG